MTFYESFIQEFKTIFSDAAVVLTILGGVILYAFLYPQPYINKNVTTLPISVVDYDRSDLSREIAFMLDSSAQVDISRHDLSEKEAKEALLRGDVKGIVIIPFGFKKDLLLHKEPTIAIGADANYFLIYGGVLEAAMKSVITQSTKFKIHYAIEEGKSIQDAYRWAMPLKLDIINFFNPNNSYIQYVIPAVFVLILQQIILIGLGIIGGGINERYYRNYDYHTPIHYALASRFIIFTLLFMIHLLFYFGFVFDYFCVIHVAHIKELLFLSLLFIGASVAMGLFLGALFVSREIATPLILMSSLILVFSAGFIWPIEAIEPWLYYLSNLFPTSSAISAFLELNQMGASLSAVISRALWLLILTFGYSIGAYFIIRYKTLKRN